MKTVITLIITIISINIAFAQHPKREKIEALKTAHITNELKLTSSEAQNFWPIYNASKDRKHQLRKQSREIHQNLKQNLDIISEKEAITILKKTIALQNKIHEEKNALINKLQHVLSAKKIIQLKKAEDEFNRVLLKKFKSRKDNRPLHREDSH